MVDIGNASEWHTGVLIGYLNRLQGESKKHDNAKPCEC